VLEIQSEKPSKIDNPDENRFAKWILSRIIITTIIIIITTIITITIIITTITI